jgi:rhodanese-related sulfurtransferase
VKERLADGAVLLDGRDTREHDAEHIPGSINVTMVRAAVGTRAAWVVDPDTPVVTTAASDAEASRMARLLEAVGFRRLEGVLAGGTAAWREAGNETEATEAVDIAGLAARLREDSVLLVDVRDDEEWEEGHVAGSVHVPYHELRDGAPDGLPNGKPLAVACSAGNRSSIAVSLLRRAGLDEVVHVAEGGIADLEHEGVELVSGA